MLSMQKVTTVQQQLKFKPFAEKAVKKVLRPIVGAALTIIDILEKIDSYFFLEDDTWQMRVSFYGFYLFGIPAFIIICSTLFLQEVLGLKYEDVLRKVKGLLVTANERANEEEAQTAFMLAQKLMIKHNISANDISHVKEMIEDKCITELKTLRWHERMIAILIANNFRVKSYVTTRRVDGRTRKALKFLGLGEDVVLATEMYKLVNEVLEFYTKSFVDNYWMGYKRDIRITSKIKNSYMRGFLNALEEAFSVQKKDLEDEYGLVVLTPMAVEKAFEEKQSSFVKSRKFSVPSPSFNAAYVNGYEDGKKIDLQQNTLN